MIKGTGSIPLWPSFLNAKCPKCRRGDMFANSMYGLHGQHMHKNCPHCGFQFEIEPGYFYVAMLLSYAFNVAEIVTGAVGIGILTGSNNPWIYVAVLLTISLILSPFNFRYSRLVLLYWLTPGLSYRPETSGDDYSKHQT
jgi:uncharacterized protein (DUF983 family)